MIVLCEEWLHERGSASFESEMRPEHGDSEADTRRAVCYYRW